MAKGDKKARSATKDAHTIECTINMHKRIKGVGFKKRAPRAVKECMKFANLMMGTSDNRVDQTLNKHIWSKGIRNVPYRIRVRLERKRNEDEDAKAQFPNGSVVEYFSRSKGNQWISAKVLGFSRGAYKLDINDAADPSKVRAPQAHDQCHQEDCICATVHPHLDPLLRVASAHCQPSYSHADRQEQNGQHRSVVHCVCSRLQDFLNRHLFIFEIPDIGTCADNSKSGVDQKILNGEINHAIDRRRHRLDFETITDYWHIFSIIMDRVGVFLLPSKVQAMRGH